jgi:hypothetical protein
VDARGGTDNSVAVTLLPGHRGHAPVAQRIEHLTTDQKVGGSNPFGRALVYLGDSSSPLLSCLFWAFRADNALTTCPVAAFAAGAKACQAGLRPPFPPLGRRGCRCARPESVREQCHGFWAA